MDQYINDFDAIMANTTTYTKAGNGAFIHSCHTHCEVITTTQPQPRTTILTNRNPLTVTA